ncbi:MULTISPECIES: peptidoglycan-binding domain-containing protein [unclassified Coleofasciculus]|uniref:peptidoglycan-binding domain-containing protein n=1 Tax=unclassified Coleofasciculus TaxID=2692782 RepID=UPI001881419C|nr:MULTISPECIES: peptidoglycan-binding protein [unclassified Coleofasciculus]MBE9127399.1 peptidoglycan-binding protein [Coleofasciculus sp. LEGE 07081]MBE9147175.1 peptidoglycan-binding protein [Coleofasciculus sp. LEGE 07092]
MQALIDKETHKAHAIATSAANKPVLQMGSVGTSVVELQKLLTHRGTYTGPIGGFFDMSVRDAVIDFQHSVFLREDGIVGSLTWTALFSGAPVNMPVLRLGSKDTTVITLQLVLRLTGDYQAPVDGDFGDRTELAVRSFQKRQGLLVDGIVDEQTWYALSQVHHRLHGEEALTPAHF